MGWVTFAADDTEVHEHTTKLDKSDLGTLCRPTAWMTDSLINFGVQEFEGVDGAYGDFHNRVLWIEPSVVKAGKDGNSEAFDNSLGAILGPAAHLDDATVNLPRNARVLLFPVNNGNRHWSLLAFFRSDRTFVHYDSLDPSNGPAASALVARLHTKGYLSAELAVAAAPAIVRQRDGYNCGVYVIQFARKIMELAGKPRENVLRNITSNSCDQFRELMLAELRPLVGHQIPSVEILPESLTGVVIAPLTKEETAISALKSVKAQVAKEDPIPMTGVSSCEDTEPSSIVVILESKDPNTQDLDAAAIKVTIGDEASPLSRRATHTGGKWMTGLNLQLAKKVKITVTGLPTHAAEFEEETLEEEFDLDQGEDKEVTLQFTPKEPRRYVPQLKFLDTAEDKQRPFPEGFKVELVLDDGAALVPGTVRADGIVVDDDDKEAGFRVPYRFKSLWLRFPAEKTPRRLGWPENSDADTKTVFDEEEDPTEGNRRSAPLPTTLWTQKPDGWIWPAPHLGDDKETFEQRHVDYPPDETEKGKEDEPLVYVMKVVPQTRMMNGHPIEHVVVLMLENRGFDHVLGYLYEGSDKPKYSYPPSPKGDHASLRVFEGLQGVNPVMPFDYDYEFKIKNPDYSRNPLNRAPKHILDKRNVKGEVRLRRGARGSNIPTTNPHEDFIHIIQDMYYVDADDQILVADPHDMEVADTRNKAIKSGGYKVPEMRGWAQNFCDGICHHRGEHTTDLRATPELIHEIGDMYLPAQLPVLNGLSRHYGVSDLWFCSVPSQTNTNRAFWASGSSAGMVKNDYYPPWHNPSFKPTAEDSLPAGDNDDGIPHRRSLFHVLDENGIDCAYYASMHYLTAPNLYITTMFPKIKKEAPKLKVAWLDQFYKDLEGGTLPPVTYIEPLWSGGAAWEFVGGLPRVVGNEFHPVADMFCGEFFIKKMYDALVASPNWETTLFVITFDENGGTYDHFPPWAAEPSGRDAGTKGAEYGFEFDCFGVRVPTLLISKYIKPGTIFRSPTAVPFDHTSVISTVLEWLEIPKDEWRLGARVENAPTFDEVLQGSGDDEEERIKKATGMAEFDAERKKRIASAKPLTADDTFYLKYVGNTWDIPKPDALDYLGGPTTYRNYYYPTTTRLKSEALQFKFEHDDAPAIAGKPLDLVVAKGDAKGYRLCVPASYGSVADTVYLVKKTCKESKWNVWLTNDRVEGAPLYDGDEVFVMSDIYDQDKVNTGMRGYDPWQRLTIDPYDAKTPKAKRWAKFRAGKWDVWRIEKA